MLENSKNNLFARIIHLRSLLAALVFCGAFWFFGHYVAEVESISFQSKFAFLLLMVVLTIYISLSLSRKVLHVFVPCSITMFTYGLLYFIDPSLEKTIFAVCASFVFYVALLGIVRFEDNTQDSTAKSFLSIGLISGLFLYLCVAYAVYINYGVPLWFFLGINFVAVFTLSIASFHLYSNTRITVILYGLVISFATLQFMWMANFWPFNYSTMAVVNLMFYYVLWDMVQASLTNSLSKGRTLTHIFISVTLLVLVLLSTRWVLVS